MKESTHTVIVELIVDPFSADSQKILAYNWDKEPTSLCFCYHLVSTVRKRGGPGLADVFNVCTSLNRLERHRALSIRLRRCLGRFRKAIRRNEVEVYEPVMGMYFSEGLSLTLERECWKFTFLTPSRG